MTVANQFPITREITFTWTSSGSGSGGENLAAFKKGFEDIDFNEYRDMHYGVPAGWSGARYSPGILHFEALLGGMFDKSDTNSLPTPGGASIPPYQPGTLVITLVSDGTYTRTKTVKGFLYRLRGGASGGSGGGLQRFQYAFLMSGEAASDAPITA